MLALLACKPDASKCVAACAGLSASLASLQTVLGLLALCGTSPLHGSSGKVHRHRLNHGGDRQTNNASWTNA